MRRGARNDEDEDKDEAEDEDEAGASSGRGAFSTAQKVEACKSFCLLAMTLANCTKGVAPFAERQFKSEITSALV